MSRDSKENGKNRKKKIRKVPKRIDNEHDWTGKSRTTIFVGGYVWYDKARYRVKDVDQEDMTVQLEEDEDDFWVEVSDVTPIGLCLVDIEKMEWNMAVKCERFIQCPKSLLGILNFEQWAFISFLADWMFFKVESAVLEKNDGWFYCPTSMVQEMVPSATPNVQQRLYRELEKFGYLRARMKYGGKFDKEEQKWKYANHRMIRLDFKKMCTDVGVDPTTSWADLNL